jgi:hypothetical protein
MHVCCNIPICLCFRVEIQTWYETLIKEIVQLTFQGTDLRKQLESGQFLL